MFLVSKDKTTVINAEQMSALYISSDTLNIRVETVSGKPWNIGRYDSKDVTQKAMKILTDKIRDRRNETIFVPCDKDIQAVNSLEGEKFHHITGKKTKGYGGS